MLTNYPLSKKIICGCDEAGRGPLAGPVVAGAVILPKDFSHPLLNDSKQLSEKHRDELRKVIEKEAIAYGVGILNHTVIDEINILNASFKAMHSAMDQMKIKPEFIIIDGNRFKPYNDLPFECVVKGDSKYNEIAAASILAKTYRDEIMQQLHEEFPIYQWDRNKGYPTVKHREAIKLHGPSPYHRMSFKLLKDDQ
ncbi:MAG: ribonuclease HII [Chitinophagales bacterium]